MPFSTSWAPRGSLFWGDGKRFQAMDVVLGLLLAEKFICVTIGEGSGEGSETNPVGRRLADLF